MESYAEQFVSEQQIVIRLAVALLLGALTGLERGWATRSQKPGERVAGLRTYALVGLLGGISALLSLEVTIWVLPVTLLAVCITTVMAYRIRMEHMRNYSITGIIGLLLTFSFGALAVAVDIMIAATAAVITTIILDNRREIHNALQRLQEHELDAALKLLLISVVMLPLLPNEGLGPNSLLNPYEIWLMVVLIASISFVGYFAMRMGGTERGILFTSLFAGLASSTALTLHFSRMARQTPALSPLLSSGILLACGTMYLRILLYCIMINPALLKSLGLPLIVMTIALYLPAFLIWRLNHNGGTIKQPALHTNPLELKSALILGALLTIILLLASVLQQWLGDTGIYVLATVSGITDVDAITLSLTRMSQNGLDKSTAILGIITAASVNNIMKACMAIFIGGKRMVLHIALPVLISLLAGLAMILLYHP
ncbi:MgtC/SapB family protein [Denitrificimonas sp. JX-1]|uniref:MgtC/SapB family protein n=1 Tax=Denitrificimonas halotolerans TaxID=3098930 RepID=A0ABU5GR39_9GAMM|nr:MgtC/SapB family protein [Denitrificimonas sp. JX-1]MDY7219299.1 MgtC/SapB family protein [Denitrificimonas sp. JX-1]